MTAFVSVGYIVRSFFFFIVGCLSALGALETWLSARLISEKFGTILVISCSTEQINNNLQLFISPVAKLDVDCLTTIWNYLVHIFLWTGIVRSTDEAAKPGAVATAAVTPASAQMRKTPPEVIICCQFCGCHGLRSEFVRDGLFCSQLCYVNFASR